MGGRGDGTLSGLPLCLSEKATEPVGLPGHLLMRKPASFHSFSEFMTSVIAGQTFAPHYHSH